tara:strand:- start:1278 stop:1499 length:222 start_codon:yes stop_codon:yes gene_type:complete
MPRPKPARYAGNTYPSIGWALGDVLLVEPRASDQRVAELLDVTPQTVQYWRVKVGIPSYKRRSARSPYLEIDP